MPGPMQGVHVVEISMWVAGPAAGGVLADWGADVVKIEPPGGDPIRSAQEVLGCDAASNPFFAPYNRGKRSVVLDFKRDDDRAAALALIDRADVLLTNMRPAALRRAGLDHEALLERNPRLVYALVTGYGLDGPDAASGAYDLGAYWARGGIADILHVPGGELPVQRSGMGDHVAGIIAAAMISAALYSRQQTGRGQLVTTSLLRTAMFQICSDYNMLLMLGRDLGYQQRASQDNPLWNNYAAADGRRFWLIGVEADRHWPALLRIVGHPEWAGDERFATRAARAANCAELIRLLDEVFATRPYDEWAALLDAERDFFWAPVRTLAEALADPQTEASGAITRAADGSYRRPMIASPADFHGTPWQVRTRAPTLGEHTAEVLAELRKDSTPVMTEGMSQ
jgi:crotonobetainyl-CoA:carnitine CoA-transferase CaiB-like acyl-CoA transferase